MVHENIFRLASLRQIIFTVKYAPVCDRTVISLGQGMMERARKGSRKKECEGKNLKNSETHGVTLYNECGSRIAMFLQKECGA